MSRLKPEHVWFQWYAHAETAPCPCCGITIMRRDDHRQWHREHIIRLALGGPDIFPNVIPLCFSCNSAMGMHFHYTFEYMVHLGKMSVQEAALRLTRHREVISQFDPICEATVNPKVTKRCPHRKMGKDEIHCWKHIKANLEAMELDD